MSTFILEAKDVLKAYGDHVVLDHVNINIRENSIFGMLGPNGAGKTSFIRILNQITAPDGGVILFNGKPLSKKDIYQIGYLPEERGLYKKMKVGEQCIYLAQLKGLSHTDAIKRLKFWFEKFEIAGWWNKRVEELSKGMQQKIQFIITVIHQPKFLIFDEPFSGFDPINVNMLKDEIIQLKNDGATIIFATHNMASVEEICDEIVLLNKAKVILEGDVQEIKNRYKTNLFNIEITAPNFDISSLIPNHFSILDAVESKGILKIRIRLPKGVKGNELLELLIGKAEIHTFYEILPSMNEVFISSIKYKNNPNLYQQEHE